jgi:hypothetical protein
MFYPFHFLCKLQIDIKDSFKKRQRSIQGHTTKLKSLKFHLHMFFLFEPLSNNFKILRKITL